MTALLNLLISILGNRAQSYLNEKDLEKIQSIETLRAYAISFVGQPYRWGGDDPVAGFDCSGLVQEILASIGHDPKGDQSADALYRHFKKTATLDKRQCGSLAFYGSEAKVTHVGFMVDNFRMVEAGGGGSKTLTKEDAIAQNAYVRIRPISNRNDLVAVLYPAYDEKTSLN